ncbi:uncharacterized protein DS421_13g412440 [Arachis hypogaea]|nr:uncharacterized protein DS421_13g412440 [Arachis hypogaea]
MPSTEHARGRQRHRVTKTRSSGGAPSNRVTNRARDDGEVAAQWRLRCSHGGCAMEGEEACNGCCAMEGKGASPVATAAARGGG